MLSLWHSFYLAHNNIIAIAQNSTGYRKCKEIQIEALWSPGNAFIGTFL